MKKRLAIWVLALLLLGVLAGPAQADREMMEPDEVDGTGRAIAEVYGRISPFSPLRIGDNPTGGDDWVQINSQFNEPRTGTGYKTHHGVDLKTNFDAIRRDGRKVFGTMLSGTASLVKLNNGSYGNTVEVRHELWINGVMYAYRDRYAHLYGSPSVNQNDPVGQYTLVGTSGDTGLGCTNPCVHLHLEFMADSAYDSNGTGDSAFLRRYPPSFFYHTQAPPNWGNDTTWITRMPAPANQASFRLTVVSSEAGASYDPDSVTLYYNTGSGWQSTTNWTSKSNHIYTIDFKTLGISNKTVLFYVQAKSSGWDGQVFRTGWRPWRHDTKAPTDRPFQMFIN